MTKSKSNGRTTRLIAKYDDLTVFHAGTKRDGDKLVTAGGRVLGITAVAENLDAAIRRAYEGVEMVSFKDCHFRHDIGIKKY